MNHALAFSQRVDSRVFSTTRDAMPAHSFRPQFREIEHLSPEYEAMIQLRDRLLRAPLGLAFTDAELLTEATDIHLAGFDLSGGLIACLVLSPDGSSARMRQVAVEPQWQGRGIGAQLVTFSEEVARHRGFTTMSLHARQQVSAFYKGLGYAETGSPFIEVSILHIAMEKIL